MLLSRTFRYLNKLPLNSRCRKLITRTQSTVAEEINKWKLKFESEQVSEPESSIKHLIAFVLDTRSLDAVDHNQDYSFSSDELNNLHNLCLARLSRMPVQYLVQDWDFRNLTLRMIPPVFIPRPETEELVDKVLEDIHYDSQNNLEILEIGCGSGAISLSLLTEIPTANCIAIDQSKLACGLTSINAENLNLQNRLEVLEYKIDSGSINIFREGKSFDLIVSNPPYVPTKELTQVQDEIKLYEDLRALDGGKDGLKIIKHILEISKNYLKPNGALWLEVHPSHPELLEKKLNESSALALKIDKVLKDLCGKERFVKIVKATA